jgi:hypothetical protein
VYTAGVLSALMSGVCQNAGLLLQKKAVNQIEAEGQERRFFARLLRTPRWLLGFAISMGLGTVFFLYAQRHLGPALIPGLMAFGLLVLVMGSGRVLGERLSALDGVGIFLLMAAIALLGLSRFSIDVARYDVLGLAFLLRGGLFSLASVALLVALLLLRRRRPRAGGLMLALVSGLLYGLSNFWVGPFMGSVLRLFQGLLTAGVLGLFAATSAILVVTNLYAVSSMQLAFRVSRASMAVPVQQIPVQVTPALVYLAVFQLSPPSPASVVFFGVGIFLVMASTFLLARRQGRFEEARSETRDQPR